jgi:paraquat-inducible protein B
MSRKGNPALIGAFVVGSFVLVLAAVAVWGSRALFERKYEYVCYFKGSVNGLDKGAPVKYRGVQVGVVKELKVRFRQPAEDRRIPAFVELWGKRLKELGGDEPTPALVDDMVAGGLRARIAPASLVTGVMYISFEDAPGTPIHRSQLPGPGAIPEIPTLPSEFEELAGNLNRFVTNLTAADIQGMTESISSAMRGVGQLAKTLGGDAQKTGALLNDAQSTLDALHATLTEAHGAVAPDAPLSVDLGAAVSDVDKAAIAVRELADFLRRNPHAIVAGTKPGGASP